MLLIGESNGLDRMGIKMNLTVLKKSRASPAVGDVFVMLPPDGLFLYGRVVAIDAKIGPMSDCYLIYVYSQRSKKKEEIPELLRGQLLTPPMMTNKLPWTKGYFETLEHRVIDPTDRLPKHCFVDTRGWYFDEYNNRLSAPVEPIGERGLQSFRTIDDKISRALGIELAVS